MSNQLPRFNYNLVKFKSGGKIAQPGTPLTPANKLVIVKVWECGDLQAAASSLGLSYKTIEYHLYASRCRLGNSTMSVLSLMKWGVKTGLLASVIFFLAGCQSTKVPPPPPPPPPKKSVLVPPPSSMPPGEASYAKAMLNSKPQGIVVLPVSPVGSGTTFGAGTYPFKSTITISALAATGYNFNHWVDGNVANPRVLSVPKGTTTLTAFFAPISPPPVTNYTITLGWNYAPSTNVVGYNLYYGPDTGNYTNHVHVGNTNIARILGLSGPKFFCVKSMTITGLESICSNEVSYQP